VLAESGRFAVGIDASAVPLSLAGGGHSSRVRGDATALPFRDNSFDLAVALDVLEHLDDDRAGAAELLRVVAPGGAAILFVPALEVLWGLQDDVSHHRRRYGRAQLRSVIEAAGFTVARLTFFNTLLFPPILAARLAMRLYRPRGLRSENELSGPVTNAILGALFAVEAPVIDKFSLPVGVSLACVARKPA
jgi:SAM-dependent methyltransferase